ncbi:hypothetical protein D3C77_523540 [compost metagenome]
MIYTFAAIKVLLVLRFILMASALRMGMVTPELDKVPILGVPQVWPKLRRPVKPRLSRNSNYN